MWWIAVAQAEVPAPFPVDAGPVVAARVDRGVGAAGPWASGAVGLGVDLAEMGVSARAWLPGAVVADAEGARSGMASPWASVALVPDGGALAPTAGLSVVTPWGTPGVVERAWGGSAWGGFRAMAGPTVLWVQAGGTMSPTLRPIPVSPPPQAGARRTAALAHGPWDAATPMSAAPDRRPPPAVADPRAPAAAEARVSLGWDQGQGLAAATATASVGDAGADVAVGLVAATSPARPVQAAVELGVPLVSARAEGARVGLCVAWRPK
jgi:hypothetical protein